MMSAETLTSDTGHQCPYCRQEMRVGERVQAAAGYALIHVKCDPLRKRRHR